MRRYTVTLRDGCWRVTTEEAGLDAGPLMLGEYLVAAADYWPALSDTPANRHLLMLALLWDACQDGTTAILWAARLEQWMFRQQALATRWRLTDSSLLQWVVDQVSAEIGDLGRHDRVQDDG